MSDSDDFLALALRLGAIHDADYSVYAVGDKIGAEANFRGTHPDGVDSFSAWSVRDTPAAALRDAAEALRRNLVTIHDQDRDRLTQQQRSAVFTVVGEVSIALTGDGPERVGADG